jgi:hypothetical protein
MAKKRFLMGMAALLVLAATLVVSCGKSPEELRAQLYGLEGDYSNAYEPEGNTEKALKLAKDALKLAKQMQKKGLVDEDEVAQVEGDVGSYTAELAVEKATAATSKDGKALAEKIKALEEESNAIGERYVKELSSRYTDPYELGVELGKAMYLGVPGRDVVDKQIKELYESVDHLSDKEFRRYTEAIGKLPEKEFEYSLTEDNKGVKVSAYYGLGGKVAIPAKIEGFPVTEVTISGDKWGEYRERITSVVIPATVQFYSNLYMSLSGLKEVSLPKGLTSIPQQMFVGCSSLASIIIPDSVTTIKAAAFMESGITSISWPAKIPVIPLEVFCRTKLKTIVIPEGVTDINEWAFYECKELTSVTLPSTIKNIEAGAFEDCPALTTITIPDSVTSLTFYGKYDAKNVTRPSGTQIDTNNGAFKGSKLGLASQARLKQLGYTGGF